MDGEAVVGDDAGAVRSASRRPAQSKMDSVVLLVSGAVLLALSVIFTWNQLNVPLAIVLPVAAAVAGGAAFLLNRARVATLGPLLLLGVTVVGGVWYGATREPLVLVGLALTFSSALGVAVAGLSQTFPETASWRIDRALRWHAVAFSGIAASFATYFHVFDVADSSLKSFIIRRGVLSLCWLLSGVTLILKGKQLRVTAMRDAGFVFVAAAVAKIICYDMLNLDGVWRIGTLALSGALLMGSALLVRRLHAGAR